MGKKTNNNNEFEGYYLTADKYPDLKNEEIEKLYDDIRSGGQAKDNALTTLIGSKPVAVTIEKIISNIVWNKKHFKNRKDDLFSIANEILLSEKASYDPDRSAFTTFTFDRVSKRLLSEFMEKYPEYIDSKEDYENSKKVKRAQREFESKYGRTPTVNELHEFLKNEKNCSISKQRIMEGLNYQPTPIKSLDNPISDDENGTTVGDFINDPNAENAIEKVIDKMSPFDLKQIIDSCNLSDICQDVIELHLGIKTTNPHTLDEIANELDITKERCKQALASSMTELKKKIKRL